MVYDSRESESLKVEGMKKKIGVARTMSRQRGGVQPTRTLGTAVRRKGEGEVWRKAKSSSK